MLASGHRPLRVDSRRAQRRCAAGFSICMLQGSRAHPCSGLAPCICHVSLLLIVPWSTLYTLITRPRGLQCPAPVTQVQHTSHPPVSHVIRLTKHALRAVAALHAAVASMAPAGQPEAAALVAQAQARAPGACPQGSLLALEEVAPGEGRPERLSRQPWQWATMAVHLDPLLVPRCREGCILPLVAILPFSAEQNGKQRNCSQTLLGLFANKTAEQQAEVLHKAAPVFATVCRTYTCM